MNFRIIYHLFKTDCLRLKWLVVAFWAVVLLTALPWLLHDPAGVTIPMPYPVVPDIRPGENNVPMSDELRAEFADAGGLRILATAGGAWMLVLAAMVGTHGRTLFQVAPVRTRERVIARGLFLLLALVLPQVGCGAVNLALHGFPAAAIGLAALSYALVTLLTLGACLLFAGWCGAGWRWLAGIAALAAAMVGCIMIYPEGVAFLLNNLRTQLWAPVCGPRTLAFFATAIVLLGWGLSLARHWGDFPRIAAAVGLVVGLAVAVSPLPVFWPVVSSPHAAEAAKLDLAGIRPEFFEGGMRASFETKESSEGTAIKEPGLSVGGILTTRGCPDGSFVAWRPEGGATLSQGGKQVAVCTTPLRYREGSSFSYFTMRPAIGMVPVTPNLFDGYFRPPVFGDTDRRARQAALPGGLAMLPGGIMTATTLGQNFYLEPFPPPIRFDQNEPVKLTASFSGTVYRYERVVDVVLTDEPVAVRDGSVTYQIRRRVGAAKNLLADVVVTHPAHGFARVPEEADWNASPTEPCQAFLQLPEQQALLPASMIRHQDGPLLSGAGWHREVYGWSQPWGMPNNHVPAFKTAGARLILLKPVVMARLGIRQATASFRIGDDEERRTDFTGSSPRTLGSKNYQEDQVPKRPDPRTCSRAEFARWLRVSAMMEMDGKGSDWRYFDYASSNRNPDFERDLASRELACYAPRFSGLMARVAFQPAVAKAIELGAPESARAEVIAALAEIPHPGFLIQAIENRGWLREAAEPLRRRFLRGEVTGPAVRAVIRLQDPATYPMLTDLLIRDPNLGDYERIRDLPGIQPALDEAIMAAWAEGQPVSPLATMNNKQDFGPFLLPAKLGDARALAGLFSAVQNLGANDIRDGMALFGEPRSLRFVGPRGYLAGKSPADFRYDTLVRRWLPIAAPSK